MNRVKLATTLATVFVATSGSVPASADPISEEHLGMVRDTLSTSGWQAKILGNGDWKARLDDPSVPYQNVYVYPYSHYPETEITPFSSGWSDRNYVNHQVGYSYYSYMTTITDNFSLFGSEVDVVLKGLSIDFSVDDHLHVIIINGTQYDGFGPYEQTYCCHGGQLYITDIDYWNVGGTNTLEFIVHDHGGSTGFGAVIQANYLITAIPEPKTYAMLLAGLGLVGMVARHRKVNVN